jgi:hypothetical protein
MPRGQSERAPKQGFGDLENDKATGSTAIRQPPRHALAQSDFAWFPSPASLRRLIFGSRVASQAFM